MRMSDVHAFLLINLALNLNCSVLVRVGKSPLQWRVRQRSADAVILAENYLNAAFTNALKDATKGNVEP
jgi:hypothetical protein